MTRTLLVTIFLFLGAASVFAQQSVFGNVKDDLGDPIIGGTVKILNGDAFLTGTATDYNGDYRISLDPGTYNIEFSYIGFTPQRVDGVVILAGQENKLDQSFEASGGVVLETATVKAFKVDPMKVDETSQGMTLTSKDVKKLGTRNINAIASMSAGATSADEGDDVSLRGGRTNATQYIIDGIRVTGTLVPESEIDQIQIVTGGVEAKYGDLSSGLISITTKGPSSKFNGFAEAETSRFLDDYNNNLVGLSLSGPIIQRMMADGKNKQTVLGYRLSGRYTYNEDDDAPASDVYYITDETRQRLENDPITSLPGGGFAPAASFLTEDDVQVLKAQPFEEFERIDVTGKLDARLNDAIDVTLSGNFTDRSNRFTPDENSRTADNWRLLNAHNNPYDLNTLYRGNFRFRHRLGNQASVLDTNNTSLISNALYTVQIGFQRNEQLLQDSRHEDRFFDYGYIGEFENSNDAVFDDELTFTNGVLGFESTHIGYRSNFRGFTPGTQNPVLANYNKVGGGDVEGLTESDIIAQNGVLANIIEDGVYTLHSSIGSIYNRYEKEKNDLITFNLQTQFDLKPGKGKSGVHNVQLGVLYEQRINRRYVLLPEELWLRGNQLANVALQDIDTNLILRTEIRDTNLAGIVLTDTTDIYGYRVETGSLEGDSRFYTQLRNKLGLGLDEYVDFGRVSPDILDIGMFSAAEASSNNTLLYYGYDYQGNEVASGGAWDDFFTARNDDGQRTFPVAPIQPIYAAGYIQDKFTFKNIILRAGFRVDYFDANTKVLKDPYELYDIQTVGNFNFNAEEVVPSNIPDDAKVYLESVESNQVKAYRVEDTWFTAEGRQVNRAAEIFTQQIPAYVDSRANEDQGYIRAEDFDPDASFEDYEAQINVMPRLAFSFPISEDANFFAHYDVLVQRPPSNTIATALDYYYFTNNSGDVFNNPNLKPTRTVDYEAGFQQRISQSSALKLSFFVREMRDMIQRRTYLFAMADLNRYTTYDNQDFGTVKGLNVSYDLRRTGPISLRLSYGLQFADGTGSDANSQRGSVQRGNLRTLYPLSYDERHRVAGALDFRYGRGEGPQLFGKPILEKLGINLSGSAVSGRPYTRLQTATQLDGRVNEGDINGARLPWNLVTNLRIDRDFSLFNENNKGVDLNVYLRVSNLLDRRNIISVYPATGLPDDDGFLASTQGQTALSSQLNQDAYIQSYQWRVLNPNFFSLPRRIFMGASFSF
ncbi:MAG: carboxypeptidase regulatory-like domain-containing protein [Saprospiraceae bacterium]